MNNYILLLSFFLFSCMSIGQNVNIPDANFKACLVADTGININGDTEIQVSEAENFTGRVLCTSMDIISTQGLEAFINTTEIALSSNEIVTIDTSQNTQITSLELFNNNITNVDLSTNTSLLYFGISINQLSSIDLSNNLSLTGLNLSSNNLNEIDVSQQTSLSLFKISNNNLDEINVSANLILTELAVGVNNITELDLTQNEELVELDVSYNAQLTSIIFPPNPILEDFVIRGIDDVDLDFNQLTNLDFIEISEITNMEVFDVSGLSQLTSISLYDMPALTGFNVNNPSYINHFLDVIDNPNLDCIEVNSNIDLDNLPIGWNINTNPTVSYDCMFLGNEDFIENSISIFPNPSSDVVTISSEIPIKQVSVYNIQGSLLFQQKEKTVSLNAIPSGIYFISIGAENGQTATRKIIKK